MEVSGDLGEMPDFPHKIYRGLSCDGVASVLDGTSKFRSDN